MDKLPISPFPQQTIKVECTPGCPHQKRWSGQGGQIWSRDGLRGEGGNEMLGVSCCFVGLCIASKNSDMNINATLETQRSPNAAVWLLNLSIFRKSPKTTRPCAHGENSNTFICVTAKTGACWVGAGKCWAKTSWIFSLEFRWHLSSAVNMLMNRKIKQLPMDSYKSPRFSDVKKNVLELETTKNPTNFLLNNPMICFYP